MEPSFDADSDVDVDADVVVVGSGAGGASFALGLAKRGLRVCILERGVETAIPTAPDPTIGPRYLSSAAQRLSRGPTLPPPLSDMFVNEGITVGGSTVAFSGNLLRFHASDFRRHTLLGDIAGASVADWPIDYDELEPYYTLLEEEIGVGGDASLNPFEPRRTRAYTCAPIRSDVASERLTAAGRSLGWHPYPVPSIITPARGRGACINCGLCTGFPCTVNARWSARAMLSEARELGVEVRTSCRVVRVIEKDGVARGVEYLDEQGALHLATGRAIALAANAIQTPALLLASNIGLVNDSGLVGRNLMTHAHDELVVGGVLPAGTRTIDSSGCKVALQDFYEHDAPLAVTLEPRALGNAALWRSLVGNQLAKYNDGPVAALGEAGANDRFAGNLTAFVMVEDVAQLDNRVTLGATRPDGTHEAIVHHASHPLDRAAARVGAERTAELLRAAGAEHIFVRPWTLPRLHVFGTCRMGDDARTSVVDRDQRSHAVRNLLIVDASVFTTSAGVNPALTVLALARRAADKLAQAFAQREL